LGVLMTAPGQTSGVMPFTDWLIDALKLTRDQLSAAYMFGSIASALVLTRAGKLYDRFGARVVGPAVCVLFAMVMLLLSQCDRLAGWLAAATGVTDATWIGFGVVLVAFFGIRFCGQGVLTMVSHNMIAKWFDRHRGLAVGICGVLVTLSAARVPALLEFLIGQYGSRSTWLWQAVVIGVGFMAFALIFWRDNPEACGLLPDGGPGRNAEATATAPPAQRQYTLKEARRFYSFWAFALALGMFGLYATGLTFHLTSVFRQAGMTRADAIAIFVPGSFIAVGVRLGGGWVSDHVHLKYLLALMLSGVLTLAMGLIFLAPGPAVWLLIIGNGVAIAMFSLLSTITWPRFFGRRHLGAIRGMTWAMNVFLSALGPWLFSQSLARTGSYRFVGWVGIAAAGVLMVMAMWANDPQRRRADMPPATSDS
jgi:MFS family permease